MVPILIPLAIAQLGFYIIDLIPESNTKGNNDTNNYEKMVEELVMNAIKEGLQANIYIQ